jgi:uncharacterized membrane protein
LTIEAGSRMGVRVTFALRMSLLLAYLPLAHFAGSRSSPMLAALALADVALIVLIEGLLAGRARAWIAMLAVLATIGGLVATGWAFIPLLLMPVLCLVLAATWFARSLAAGREPLITRIVAALYRQSGHELTPTHQRYTRRLTALWAGLLALLAAINLGLALLAVPDGVLARLGVSAPLTVTQAQWSLFANLLNYGIVGGALVVEYHWRKRVFPQRPYRNFVEFVRRMAALGPTFWRDVFR